MNEAKVLTKLAAVIKQDATVPCTDDLAAKVARLVLDAHKAASGQ